MRAVVSAIGTLLASIAKGTVIPIASASEAPEPARKPQDPIYAGHPELSPNAGRNARHPPGWAIRNG
jgi:hypothetical protein